MATPAKIDQNVINKCKIVIKKWEKDFIDIRSCAPTLADIKSAPKEVKDAYRVYWENKRSTQAKSSTSECGTSDTKVNHPSANDEIWSPALNRSTPTIEPQNSLPSTSSYSVTLSQRLKAKALSLSNLENVGKLSKIAVKPLVQKQLVDNLSSEITSISPRNDVPTPTEVDGSDRLNTSSFGSHSANCSADIDIDDVFVTDIASTPNGHKTRLSGLDTSWLSRQIGDVSDLSAISPHTPHVSESCPKPTFKFISPSVASTPNFVKKVGTTKVFTFSPVAANISSNNESVSSTAIAEISGNVSNNSQSTDVNMEVNEETKEFSLVSKRGRARKNVKTTTTLPRLSLHRTPKVHCDESLQTDCVSMEQQSSRVGESVDVSENRMSSRSRKYRRALTDSDFENDDSDLDGDYKPDTDSLYKTDENISHNIFSEVDNDIEKDCKSKRASTTKNKSRTSKQNDTIGVPTTSGIRQRRVAAVGKKGKCINNEYVKEIKTTSETNKATTKVGFNRKRDNSDEIDPKPAAKRAKIDTSDRIASKYKRITAKQRLEKTMEAGTVNENYRRINQKIKRYSRGHRKLNMKNYKYQCWKMRQTMKNPATNEVLQRAVCFRCGSLGHWAKYCGVAQQMERERLAEESAKDTLEEEIDDPLPTLEQAAAMARGVKNPLNLAESASCSQQTTNENDDPLLSDFSQMSEVISQSSGGFDSGITSQESDIFSQETDCSQAAVSPFLNGENIETPSVVYETLRKMNFENFRPGQERVIMRILAGKSTLMVSSTGSGKSLCYQLPAFIYAQRTNCVAIVISPLISLMEDQVSGLPNCFRAVCLHSGLPEGKKKQVLDEIRSGNCHAVLVSPEAIVSAGCGGQLLADMPPISFACIDEAHCLSEWSHNFRPSYLQLYKILTEKLGVRCILALTATATKSTCLSIARHLGIADATKGGIVGVARMPSNLILSVSHQENRHRALIELLKGDRFRSYSSIIVYCTRREQTEQLATLIRTSLQHQRKEHVTDAQLPKNSKARVKALLDWDAEAYHAGLSAARRRSVQNKFMSGKLRVVVATVAFGMGIDKADIRAVIHFNVPKSFENYVQEAGRAGRDGLRSDCHVFLEEKSDDMNDLKRFIYANSTDRYTIRKFLNLLFAQHERFDKLEVMSKELMMEVALPVESTVHALDMKEENILTLMCFLEFHPRKYVKVLHKVYGQCTIRCYGGPAQLKAVAKKSPPIAAAMALGLKCGNAHSGNNELTFSIVEVASFMGWNSKLVKRDIKRLEWDTLPNGSYRKSGVMVEFSDLCFHLKVRREISVEEREEILTYLYNRCEQQEKLDLKRLKKVNNAFKSVAYSSCLDCCDHVDTKRSDRLKAIIHRYFDNDVTYYDVGQNIDDVTNSTGDDDNYCTERKIEADRVTSCKSDEVMETLTTDNDVTKRPTTDSDAREGLTTDSDVREGLTTDNDVTKMLTTDSDVTNVDALNVDHDGDTDEDQQLDTLTSRQEEYIRAEIRGIVSVHHDQQFTARSIARIFHGIGSPRFPPEIWGRVRRFWRAHLDVEFKQVLRMAQEELLKIRS